LVGVAGLLALVGALTAWWSATVPILGLTLLVWLFVEWVLFTVRYRSSADRLVVERVLIQGDRTVPAVWAGTKFTVRLTVSNFGAARLPYVLVEDRVPADYTAKDWRNRRAFDLPPGDRAVLEYNLRAEAPGVLRFEGVMVRVADVAGLFYRRLFLRVPVEYLVLPPLTDDEGKHRGAKKFNTLPPPGVHRLRRPGSGSELLDLRDYRPGDPPKMIAWKASARRDRLITKEFESEVPVRCVLFLDASNGARVGPPGYAPVIRLAEVGAAVAQAAAANRDLVGLTVFDEEAADVAPPARTQVHMIQMLRKLGEAAARLPDPKQTDADLLARYAYPLAQELYPDLLTKDVNSRPIGMYWIPIADTRWFWLILALLCWPLLLTQKEVLEAVAKTAATFSGPGESWKWMIVLVLLPGVLAGLIWLVHGIRGFFAPRSIRTARRKQLGALFAMLDGTGPAAVERHLHDEADFSRRATRFLLDHRVRLPLVLYDRDGNYRFRSERKVEVLAAALTRAVSRARDNELYLVLADLAELAADLQPLVNAAKVARARHHQVLVIVPWPADMPPPYDAPPSGGKAKAGVRIGVVVRSVLVSRYHHGFDRVRSALAKAGATVVRVEDEDPVQLVLERLDRLRGAARVRR
jgi:uncharacterized protein (DUF58 family)